MELYVSDELLETRISRGEIKLSDLKSRSHLLGWTNESLKPIPIGDKFCCPVCASELPENCNLVLTQFNNLVCDYCAPFIEG